MRLTSESEFSAWLRKKLGGHSQRIESGVGSGIPDINWCYGGNELWIETKLVIPKKGVLLRKEQFAWGMRRASHGGCVLIIALDTTLDRVLVWRYPFPVVLVGKYLAIAECPRFNQSRADVIDFSVYLE